MERYYKLYVVLADNTSELLGLYSDFQEANINLTLYRYFPYHEDAVFLCIIKDGFLYKKVRVD